MTERGNAAPICLAMTGASGGQYGLRLLQCLLGAGERVHLLVSPAARVVLSMECGLALPKRPRDVAGEMAARYSALPGQLTVFGEQEWTAPLASGSAALGAMAICPCTTGTLASVALGTSDNLIERAADVTLKEQRRLVMVVREAPLSAIHLEHMLKLARLGVVMMPASPGFYHAPRRVDDLVDFVVARVLDQLGVAHGLLPPWGSDRAKGE
jgi:4-hydroxy-3-polyprenylbenzoate decarboxylase